MSQVSAHAATPEQVDDRKQHDRTDQRRDQETDDPATKAQAQCRQQPAADETTDDADDDVQDDALLSIRLHDQTGQPSGNTTYHNY